MEKNDKRELLDALEDLIVVYTQQVCKTANIEVTKQQARNLVAKIGARIMYEPTLGKEKVDELLTPSNT